MSLRTGPHCVLSRVGLPYVITGCLHVSSPPDWGEGKQRAPSVWGARSPRAAQPRRPAGPREQRQVTSVPLVTSTRLPGHGCGRPGQQTLEGPLSTQGDGLLILHLSSSLFLFLPLSSFESQGLSTRSNVGPQGTTGNVWGHFWLHEQRQGCCLVSNAGSAELEKANFRATSFIFGAH